MVQLGHGLRAPLPATTPDAERPRLRPSDVPPPPPGEVVPTYGYRVLSHGERLTLAQHMLATHQPDGPVVRVGLAWPFVAVNDRSCTWCRNPWPCLAASWAQQAQFTAHGWAL